VDTKTSILATKEDLVAEIGSTKQALDKWKTDIIKWMFIYHLTQTIMTGFLFYLFLKK